MPLDKTNHILVGLGGTGGKILRAFKMRMFEEFPDFEERSKKPVALLYVDSTREMMGIGREDFNVMGKDASFTEDEFLFIKGIDVPALLDNIGNYPQLRAIVNNVQAVRTAIGSLGEAAGQKRRAGRLLFAANASSYVRALQNAYSRCHAQSGNNTKVVHIFAGLNGGTGSGSIIDAIAQARKLWDDAVINVYAMMPEKDLPKPDMDKGRYYQNGYAALNELNALQCGRLQLHDVTGEGALMTDLFDPRIKGVANGITIYSNANENGRIVDSFNELPKIVSDYVYSRVFLINPDIDGCKDIIRAYNFENMDDFALEFDETVPPTELRDDMELPIVRTKKINSFGIKRVIYPELRVLKHITYTTGKAALDQFKFNNWRESIGFVEEEANKDYRGLYLTEKHLTDWMLDLKHITLESKVLPSDAAYPTFFEDWQSLIGDFAETSAEADNPLLELQSQMDFMFTNSFRGVGVEEYYKGKERSLKEIAAEIRKVSEIELFNKWRSGEISIIELTRVTDILLEYVHELKKNVLDVEVEKTSEKLEESKANLDTIRKDWSSARGLGVMVGLRKNKDDFYSDFQVELPYYFEARTMSIALAFAIKLQQALVREFTALSSEIGGFSKLVSDAIDETNRLITSQRKVNKGLDDMKGAVVEVSEDESMVDFEQELTHDKSVMTQISQKLREAIITGPFISFGDLTQRLSVEDIKKSFDVTLSEIVKTKHADKPKTETKVLGLNILTQLQQKLDTEKKIHEFAHDILEQSGAYLYLDTNQMSFHVRNNPIPDDNQNIKLKEVFISMPAPDDNPNVVRFAQQLEAAFKAQTTQGNKAPTVFTESTRKNELSIITISYCYPMRAMAWMKDYRKKYDKYLNTGNANNDLNHRILLHCEGDGRNLPSIFALSNEELKEMEAQRVAQQPAQPKPSVAEPAMPPVAGPTPPPVTPPVTPPPFGGVTPPPVEPQVQLYLNIGGQNYGPYDWATCKQLAQNKQLTADTMVWEQGMAAWMPAGQVSKLSPLFAPAVPPAMPGMPPMPPAGSMPPPLV